MYVLDMWSFVSAEAADAAAAAAVAPTADAGVAAM